jgi:hypothetical protein
MSALFDFPSLLIMMLLVICSATFARSLRPEIFNDAKNVRSHTGFLGIAWKASRIGERLSLYVSGSCLIAAIYILFIK